MQDTVKINDGTFYGIVKRYYLSSIFAKRVSNTALVEASLDCYILKHGRIHVATIQEDTEVKHAEKVSRREHFCH